MSNTTIDNLVNRLKDAWDENPIAVMTAASMVFAGVAKVVNAYSGYRNTIVWKQEVRRREEKQRARRTKYDR